MKEIKSKFLKDHDTWVMHMGLLEVEHPNPDFESYEQYHYLMREKRIIYEKYESGILPKDIRIDTPNFRRFMQSRDKNLILKDLSVIKLIFDCDKNKKKYRLIILEFLEYKKLELSSTPMRKMIEILASTEGFVKTAELVKKAGFKNRETLQASKRRLNGQIRKTFGITIDFLVADQGNGYRISESFLVLTKS